MKNVIDNSRIFLQGIYLLPLLIVTVLPLLYSCHRENDTDRLLAEIENQIQSNTVDGDSIL